jgi:N-acetyl-anhydromuramyl-L-alanine amidase AmpD
MRNITNIIIHCTAGSQSQTIADLRNWWRKGMGWKNVGYHWVVEADGKATRLAEDSQITNGVAGFNRNAIHISWFGGITKDLKPIDNRTDAQKESLKDLVEAYKRKYPKARVRGHRDFSADKNKNGIIEANEWVKNCPAFDVATWLKSIGL